PSAMPPPPTGTGFRSRYPLRPASQHPTGDEPRDVIVGSYNPDCSYHSGLPLSPDGRVEPPIGPPSVLSNLKALARACGLKQNGAEPRCVCAMKVEGLAKYTSLVPASRMGWIQAIVLDLADIEDCFIAMRQTHRHDARLASHVT